MIPRGGSPRDWLLETPCRAQKEEMMAAYAFMLPILPGQEETDRRLFAEMQGPRRAEYEAAWRRLGVKTERVWHQQTPEGTFAVVYLEADDLGRVFTGLATSDDPFVTWWREQILTVHGVDLSQPLPGPPNAQIHDWSDA
jgi:hypothetical protein